MKLCEKIIKLRKEKGLSQEEFGNAINVSRQAVSKWESEQTKPDIDKLKEIAKFFNVSYEYLLNDEIENLEETQKESAPKPKKTKKIIARIVSILVLIYLLISIYKLIGLVRFYKFADRFSEDNYSMLEIYSKDDVNLMDYATKKVGDRIIKTTSNPYDEESPVVNENGEIIPYDIEFIDTKTKEWYKLHYDNETKTYQYQDCRRNVDTEEELNAILNGDRHYLKELTLDFIPSDFKEIVTTAFNPLSKVSILRNEIYVNNFNKVKMRTLLTKDGLLENYIMETELDGKIEVGAHYNYVQENLKEEITPPLEEYKDKIVNLEDIK